MSKSAGAIRAIVLWDIDGTLLDAGGAGQAAMEEAFRDEFGTTMEAVDIPTAGRTDHSITRDLFEFFKLTHDDESALRLQRSYFERLPRFLSGKPGAVYPGIAELLDRLLEMPHVKLGLLTGNFEEGAWMKLDHFGLRKHFGGGAFGDHFPDRDDVARSVLPLIAEWCPGQDCPPIWVIGDTPADIRCARAIGAKAVAVATGIYSREELAPHRPDFLVDDFRDHDWLLRELADTSARL